MVIFISLGASVVVATSIPGKTVSFFSVPSAINTQKVDAECYPWLSLRLALVSCKWI